MENSEHNKSDRPFSDKNIKNIKRNVDEINIFYNELMAGVLIKIIV